MERKRQLSEEDMARILQIGKDVDIFALEAKIEEARRELAEEIRPRLVIHHPRGFGGTPKRLFHVNFSHTY